VVEDESVAGGEDGADVDVMEEREEIQDEAEAWAQAHLMQEPPTKDK
jgi:hypothetical protein